MVSEQRWRSIGVVSKFSPTWVVSYTNTFFIDSIIDSSVPWKVS